ncbi:putative transporter [Clostridium liquoris]|jgi:MFS family permease|uniref:Putative transporter n=2 Tax=Clostridium liquoris TaxID=1289519 RepID=A0A2T0B3B6_9CLOT|nr:putative transporter [Clostridium liquoris]
MGEAMLAKGKLKEIPQNALLYLYSIAFFYISSGAFSMLQGIYIKELNYGESFLGTILSLKILATAVFSIPCAIFVNKMGKKKAMMMAFIFVPLMNICQGYFSNRWLMLLFAVMQGAATSFLLVSEGPFFMENSTEKNRLRLFSTSFVVNVFSNMIGYFSFGQISQRLEFKLTSIEALKYSIIVSGIIGFVACVFAIKIKDSNAHNVGKNENLIKKYIYVLKQKHPSQYVIYNFIIGFGAGLVVPYFNVYLKYKVNVSTESIGIIMALAQGAMGIGGLITPIMAKRYGKIKTIIICQTLSVPFLMLIALPPSVIIVSLALFIRNALMNMAGPITSNLSMEMVDNDHRPIFSSIINISSNLSRALSAMVAGFIMNNLANGYEIPYFITAIMYIGGTVYFYKCFNTLDKRNKSIIADR